MFENYSKCRIWILEFWYFSQSFDLLQVTCLVTLFERIASLLKLSHFKFNSGVFRNFLGLLMLTGLVTLFENFWHFQLIFDL